MRSRAKADFEWERERKKIPFREVDRDNSVCRALPRNLLLTLRRRSAEERDPIRSTFFFYVAE